MNRFLLRNPCLDTIRIVGHRSSCHLISAEDNHTKRIICSHGSCPDVYMVPKRGFRRWNRALPFPPDKEKWAHHFFLPSLKQQLDELEAKDNPVAIHDIGLSHEEFMKRVVVLKDDGPPDSRGSGDDGKRKTRGRGSGGASRRPSSNGVLELDVETPEDLVKLADVPMIRKELNYDTYSIKWYLSQEGKGDIIEMAHHYQIFRDLFSSPSVTKSDVPKLPKAKIPNFIPPADEALKDKVLKEWFSGSVPLKDPKPKDIFYFRPHVPIYAEFSVPESFVRKHEDHNENSCVGQSSSDDDLITTPVFRGNLIKPVYACSKPSVVLDVRGSLNDETSSHENQLKSYFEEVDLGIGVKMITGHNKQFSAGNNYYTVVLLNLDTQFGDEKPVCHWMLANIRHESEKTSYDEMMSYLPVYGLRGLGYHRYVFLVYHHKQQVSSLKRVEANDLKERMFDPLDFMKSNDTVPVGLSWFQSQWDLYSQKVLHHVLDMRSPVYEYIQRPATGLKQVKYPPLAPFNVYLDHHRDPKELNKEALLERLKQINPFDYSKEYQVDPLPNAYEKTLDQNPVLDGHLKFNSDASWRNAWTWKKRNRLAHFRCLRPASARIPLNNNLDLDYPIWPYSKKLELPNKYPDQVRRPKPLRETKWTIPPSQHPTYRVEHEDIPTDQQDTSCDPQ